MITSLTFHFGRPIPSHDQSTRPSFWHQFCSAAVLFIRCHAAAADDDDDDDDNDAIVNYKYGRNVITDSDDYDGWVDMTSTFQPSGVLKLWINCLESLVSVLWIQSPSQWHTILFEKYTFTQYIHAYVRTYIHIYWCIYMWSISILIISIDPH